MDTENLYGKVRDVQEHLQYILARNAAAQLLEAFNAGALERLSLDELEELISELSLLIAQKERRLKEFGQLSLDELRQISSAVAAELKSRKEAAVAKTPPAPGPKPTISKATASESAPLPARGDLIDLSGPIDVKWERRK